MVLRERQTGGLCFLFWDSDDRLLAATDLN